MIAELLLVSLLSSAPATTSVSTPVSPNAAFVESFQCPSVYPTNQARIQAAKHFLQSTGTWPLSRALKFRHALLRLHDCTQTLQNIRRNTGNTNRYPYVATSLLPRASATKNCFRPNLETFPTHRVDKMRALRNKAEEDLAAFKKLKKLATSGDKFAEFFLATLFDPTVETTETTVAKDWGNANSWYLKAAKDGIAGAQISIGNSYGKGTGVPTDRGTAVHWYRLAAQNGYVDAAWNMGVAYDYGRGVKKSAPEARRWYCTAAIEGDREAQWHLAATYYLGEGVPPDLSKTFYWLKVLSKEGDQGASILRVTLRKGIGKKESH